MGDPGSMRKRAATLLLVLAWGLLALAMAEPVVEWVLQSGYRGLPYMGQSFPGAIRPFLFGSGGAALVTALALLFRMPAGSLHSQVAWHTRVLRVGGMLVLFGGGASLVSALSYHHVDLPTEEVIRNAYFLGAFLGGATGSLLFSAFLARHRGWGSAPALTAAANLVLGFFVPAGTFLMVVWLIRVQPQEELPPPG